MQPHRPFNALLVGEVVLGELVNRCGENTRGLGGAGQSGWMFVGGRLVGVSSRGNKNQTKGSVEDEIQGLCHLVTDIAVANPTMSKPRFLLHSHPVGILLHMTSEQMAGLKIA